MQSAMGLDQGPQQQGGTKLGINRQLMIDGGEGGMEIAQLEMGLGSNEPPDQQIRIQMGLQQAQGHGWPARGQQVAGPGEQRRSEAELGRKPVAEGLFTQGGLPVEQGEQLGPQPVHPVGGRQAVLGPAQQVLDLLADLRTGRQPHAATMNQGVGELDQGRAEAGLDLQTAAQQPLGRGQQGPVALAHPGPALEIELKGPGIERKLGSRVGRHTGDGFRHTREQRNGRLKGVPGAIGGGDGAGSQGTLIEHLTQAMDSPGHAHITDVGMAPHLAHQCVLVEELAGMTHEADQQATLQRAETDQPTTEPEQTFRRERIGTDAPHRHRGK